MQKRTIVTPQDTIRAILQRSNRQAVPIRKSFLRGVSASGRSPLADLVRHHDTRALDLYLLVLAQASGGAFDVVHPAAVWARALHLTDATGAAAVSKVLARLVDYRLIARDRLGRRAHLTLLCEDGSGRSYTHPAVATDRYLQLSHAYWLDGWDTKLTLPGKAALLVARSLPSDFFLPIESAPKQFGISADTLGDGLRELVTGKLLDRRTVYKPDPLSAVGYKEEYHYTLLAPFHRPSKARSGSAAAAMPPPTAPGAP